MNGFPAAARSRRRLRQVCTRGGGEVQRRRRISRASYDWHCSARIHDRTRRAGTSWWRSRVYKPDDPDSRYPNHVQNLTIAIPGRGIALSITMSHGYNELDNELETTALTCTPSVVRLIARHLSTLKFITRRSTYPRRKRTVNSANFSSM